MCSGTNSSLFPLLVNVHPMQLNIVLENILSCLGREDQHDLIRYRLVCHQWNEEIVRLLTKSKTSFQIPFRYGPQVQNILYNSCAQEEAKLVLKNVMKILNDTRLLFDSVLVDRDFYLSGVSGEWSKFLETHGKSIKHLKFNIRPGKQPKEFENRVLDVEEIVSAENLTTTFALTPNLESLDFCVRFSYHLIPGHPVFNFSPLQYIKVPQLKHLKKVRICGAEGEGGGSHVYLTINKFITNAPNLTDLYIKGENGSMMFFHVQRRLLKEFKKSLNYFSVENDLIHGEFPLIGSGHGVFNLRTVDPVMSLTLYGAPYNYLDGILQGSPMIETIVLRGTTPYVEISDRLRSPSRTWSTSTSVFQYLKRLELNLTQFNLRPDIDLIPTYESKFPVLETLVFTGYGSVIGNEWTYAHVMELLSGESQRSYRVRHFYIEGQIQNDNEKLLISSAARATFPRALQYFNN